MRRLLDHLNAAAATVLGVFLMAVALRGLPGFSVLSDLASALPGQALLLLVGLLLAGWNAALVLRDYRAGLHRRNFEMTTAEGANTVSIRALETHLLDELARASDVSDARVTLSARGEGVPLACTIRFRLRRQDNIMARVDQVKKAVRDAFLRVIPSGGGIEIAAEVTDLVATDAPAASPSRERSGASEFSGPVYPEAEAEEEEVRF